MTEQRISLLQRQLISSGSLKERMLIQDTIDSLKLLQGNKIQSSYQISKNISHDDRLKQFQLQGVSWLLHKFKLRQNCLLADEPGLGKTVQVIVFLKSIQFKRVLILSPPTLCLQWVQMAQYWDLNYDIKYIKYGSDFSQLQHNKICVISYDLAVANIQKIQGIVFDILVSDEVHYLRNIQTQRYQALIQLKAQFNLGLSGTPIQNSYEELFSIFSFLKIQGMPDQDTFYENFVNPIKLSFGCQKVEAVKRGAQAAKQLQKIISPAILRRLKTQVGLELPPKVEITILFRLSQQQEEVYQQQLKNRSTNQQTAFRVLQKLQSICDYPNYSENLIQPLNSTKLYWITQKICQITKINLNNDVLTNSFNIELFDTYEQNQPEENEDDDEIITEFDTSVEKIIIFSPSLNFLQMIEHIVKRLKLSYTVLTGSISQSQRQIIVRQFNQTKMQILLATPQVGGIGLNLTAANHIIISSPSWNPAVDMQAAQRAWRMGQKRKTYIYRFAAAGTIEEVILDRQQLKQIMADRVLENAFEQVKNNVGSVFTYYQPVRDVKIRSFQEKEIISKENQILQKIQVQSDKKQIEQECSDYSKLASYLLDKNPFITDSFFPPPIDIIMNGVLQHVEESRLKTTQITQKTIDLVLLDFQEYSSEISHCIKILFDQKDDIFELKATIFI